MATFQPLASKIGMTLAISPTVKRGGLNMGLNNATGEFIADADKGKFEFTYSTTLAHLIYNEFNNANISPDPGLYSQLINPGPYRFQEKGLEAFQRVAADARLPEPTYTITTIRVR